MQTAAEMVFKINTETKNIINAEGNIWQSHITLRPYEKFLSYIIEILLTRKITWKLD